MPMHCSIVIHDWNAEYAAANPIVIVTTGEVDATLRIGELSIISTRERLAHLRDKITAALAPIDTPETPDAEEAKDAEPETDPVCDTCHTDCKGRCDAEYAKGEADAMERSGK